MAIQRRVMCRVGCHQPRGRQRGAFGHDDLGNLDWAVAEGENWVVLGPNGAGKTTVLQVAATLVHPSSGTAEVLDERIGRVDVFGTAPTDRSGQFGPGRSGAGLRQVRDVVLTSAWAVLGRWRESYDPADEQRAGSSADLGSCEPGRPTLRDVE